MVLIIIDNLLAGDDVTLSSSSEDTLYVLENLYNGRPSKPFRFTGIGAVGVPEWICAEFDAPKNVTFAGIFNHNLTALAGGNDSLLLKADDGTCAGATWAAPDYQVDLKTRIVENWNDIYRTLSQTRLSYRFEFIDTANTHGHVEVGELVLGVYTGLDSAYLKPGRVEDPKYYSWRNVTPYGQHWQESLSYGLRLDLTVTNLGDPGTVDAVRVILQAIHAANGRFVIVPNHLNPMAYYVALESDGGFMANIMRGPGCEANEWTFELMTLTKGIRLL